MGAESGHGQDEPLDVAEIGRRLRKHRTLQQRSLESVAKVCDISPSLLSQVERGKVTPSLTTLHRVSQTLGVPIFDLFGSPSEQPAVVRAGARNVLRPPDAGGVSYELLSTGALRRLQMLEVRLGPTGGSFDHSLSHDGDECVVVLEGRAVVEVGADRFELDVGDSLSFHARLPHRFVGAEATSTRLVVAMTPPAF